MIIAAEICSKCHKINKLGYPGIDTIRPSWYKNTANLMHIKQDMKNLLK